MRYLVLLMFLMGCAAPQPVSLNPLRERLHELTYQIEHDKCFIAYNKCRLDKKVSNSQCWDSHESCVIDVYRRYKLED